mgnify:CR=1 FL=1
MAHVIGDDCISCGSCEAECPVSAISEGDGKYEINADACIDCGAMCSTVPSRSNFRGIRFHTYKI